MTKLIEIDYEPGALHPKRRQADPSLGPAFSDELPESAARRTSTPAPASTLVAVDYEPAPYEGGLPAAHFRAGIAVAATRLQTFGANVQ